MKSKNEKELSLQEMCAFTHPVLADPELTESFENLEKVLTANGCMDEYLECFGFLRQQTSSEEKIERT